MKSFLSEGLPSRPILRAPEGNVLASALDASKLPAPRAPNTEATLPMSFLRLKNVEVIVPLLRFLLILVSVHETNEVSRQRKTKNVISRSDGHVLFVLNCVGHGRSPKILSCIEVPQGLSGLRIHRFKRLCGIAKKNQ